MLTLVDPDFNFLPSPDSSSGQDRYWVRKRAIRRGNSIHTLTSDLEHLSDLMYADEVIHS